MKFNKGAMFGLDCRALKKQFGELFLASRQSEARLGANGSCGYFKHGAMFGLDARIALAIFGALSVISGAALYSAIQNSKATAIYTQMAEVAKAYESYYIDTGSHPSIAVLASFNGKELLTNTSNTPGWKGPYLSLEWITAESKFLSFDENKIEVALFESDNWGLTSSLTPDILCEDGDKCSVYISTHSIDKNIALLIDQKFDDGNDETGNIRRFPGSFGNIIIWLKSLNYN